MQGYDTTLFSLTMKRPDRPLVQQERDRRPHVDAFANLTPIDESTLIERSQLLDTIVDDEMAKPLTTRSQLLDRDGKTLARHDI